MLVAISKLFSLGNVLQKSLEDKTHCRYHYSKGMQKHYLGEDRLELGISFFE